MSSTKAGNHNDLHEIGESMKEIFSIMKQANTSRNGLFINADAGFNSKDFRMVCSSEGIIPNVCFNYRNGEEKDNLYFEELLYEERYSIERTNAWMDSFRLLLIRFDTIIASWESFNYIAFIVLLVRKVKRKKKKKFK